MNLQIHRLAVGEIDRAVAEIDRKVDYYESRHTGLRTELENEIDPAFSLIPLPQRGTAVGATGQIAVLDRFPFTIPY